jgi:tetratricopeptide (TPR) repeat protein
MRALLVCVLLVAVAPGCDKKDDSAKSESASKKEKKEKKSEESGEEACADGTEDPSNDDFVAIAKGDSDYKKAAKKFPASARVHVAGGRYFITQKPPEYKDAYAAYSKALAMLDGGCKLTDMDTWDALEGGGIAALGTKKYDEAKKYLARAAKKWPGIAETRYNLACAHCRLDDADACFDELKAALEAADEGKVPAFIKVPKDAAHFAKAARKDEDLTLISKEKRFDKLVSKYE